MERDPTQVSLHHCYEFSDSFSNLSFVSYCKIMSFDMLCRRELSKSSQFVAFFKCPHASFFNNIRMLKDKMYYYTYFDAFTSY